MDTLINDFLKQGANIKVFPISSNAWVDVGQWNRYLDFNSKN